MLCLSKVSIWKRKQSDASFYEEEGTRHSQKLKLNLYIIAHIGTRHSQKLVEHVYY